MSTNNVASAITSGGGVVEDLDIQLNSQNQCDNEHLYQLIIEADKLRFQRRFSQALDIMSRVIQLNPKFFLVYYKLALYYYQKDDELHIYRCLQLALLYCDDWYWFCILHAYLRELRKELEESKHYYELAIKFVEQHNQYVASHCASTENDGGSSISSSNLGNGSSGRIAKRYCHDAFFNLACVHMDLHNYDVAIELFLRAIQEVNKMNKEGKFNFMIALIYNNIGCCYVDKSDDVSARVNFEHSIQKFDSYVLAYQNLMRLYRRTGLIDEIPVLCDKVLSITDDHDTVRNVHREKCEIFHEQVLSGAVEIGDNMFEPALQLIQKYPREHFGYFSLAVLYAITENSDKMKEIIESGLQHVSLGDKWGYDALLTCLAYYYRNHSRTDNPQQVRETLRKIEDLKSAIITHDYLERLE